MAMLYINYISVKLGRNIFCYSQFPRVEGMPHHAQPCGETPGWVRRQKECCDGSTSLCGDFVEKAEWGRASRFRGGASERSQQALGYRGNLLLYLALGDVGQGPSAWHCGSLGKGSLWNMDPGLVGLQPVGISKPSEGQSPKSQDTIASYKIQKIKTLD